MNKVFNSCFVPRCRNNTSNSRNKLFIRVPQNKKSRKNWFKAVGVPITTNNNIFCCEDHFMLQEDSENFQRHKLVGTKLFMKSNVVPHLNLVNAVAKRESQITDSAKKRRFNFEVESTASCSKQLFADEVVSHFKIPMLNIKQEPVDILENIKLDWDSDPGSAGEDNIVEVDEYNTSKEVDDSIKSELQFDIGAIKEEESELQFDIGAIEEEDITLHNLKDEPDYVYVDNNDYYDIDGMFKCLICHKQYVTKNTLKSHIAIHDARYECTDCSRRFSFQSALTVHLRTHSGGNPHQCDICHKSFAHADGLTVHRRYHTGEKPYQCNICHRRFTTSSNFTVHRRTHINNYLFISCPEDKLYQCDICHKRFSSNTNLSEHARMHTGEKPFECGICHSKYSRKNLFTKHILSHRVDNTVNTPYHCDVCDKTITSFLNITEHMRSHTGEKPYGCDICHKRFSRRRAFAEHMDMHVASMMYQCDICHKRYAQKNSFKIHMRLHTGEKPYQCQICHTKFALKGSLAIHMRVCAHTQGSSSNLP